ncbi:MAG: zinc ribbon domain-containing protein [Dehalococcoidia bacterium]|nr:zinc ribbon domain-containing protein [Dehalococcoidia bacterium]
MPIYEYVCTTCHEKFDLLRSVGRMDDSASCPCCRNGAKRVLSTFASFSKGANGESQAVAGAGRSCSGCSAGDCSTCH